MLESTILGAAIGFLGRMAPDVLKYADKHLERRHELAMLEASRKHAETRGATGGKVEEVGGFAAGPQTAGMIDALRESWKQQLESRDPKVARISSLVRPMTTYIMVAVYVAAKVVMLVSYAAFGKGPVASAYTTEDAALLSGVLAYWFLSRTIDKAK